MNFNEYQELTSETAVYPKEIGLAYVTMGLAGEAGEIANKVKKVYRDNGGILSQARRQELADELGDSLWYTAQLATVLGLTLDEIAEANLAKLFSRLERGTIKGSGDNR